MCASGKQLGSEQLLGPCSVLRLEKEILLVQPLLLLEVPLKYFFEEFLLLSTGLKMSPGKGYFSKAAVGFPSSVPLQIWGAKPGA